MSSSLKYKINKYVIKQVVGNAQTTVNSTYYLNHTFLF